MQTPSKEEEKETTKDYEASEDVDVAMNDLKGLLQSRSGKKLTGQNKQRHETVLVFLQLQHSRRGAPLEDTRRATLANIASRSSGKGAWFAKQIVKWAKSWLASRTIPEGKIGCKSNVKSWLKDEGLLLYVREWLGKEKNGKTKSR